MSSSSSAKPFIALLALAGFALEAGTAAAFPFSAGFTGTFAVELFAAGLAADLAAGAFAAVFADLAAGFGAALTDLAVAFAAALAAGFAELFVGVLVAVFAGAFAAVFAAGLAADFAAVLTADFAAVLTADFDVPEEVVLATGLAFAAAFVTVFAAGFGAAAFGCVFFTALVAMVEVSLALEVFVPEVLSAEERKRLDSKPPRFLPEPASTAFLTTVASRCPHRFAE
jgi:hypothetical protein